ncbi:early endosome antigen 1 [Platysternon megacephalum]|uniref:Early endosome antigen 1 n=1 Tax=Platysternon megacephalum TaxID=55544 RepID=A0A4D9EBW4_9SAUR|nr:early endosome antigen 1 [Platysternon megacephalum]
MASTARDSQFDPCHVALAACGPGGAQRHMAEKRQQRCMELAGSPCHWATGECQRPSAQQGAAGSLVLLRHDGLVQTAGMRGRVLCCPWGDGRHSSAGLGARHGALCPQDPSLSLVQPLWAQDSSPVFCRCLRGRCKNPGAIAGGYSAPTLGRGAALDAREQL